MNQPIVGTDFTFVRKLVAGSVDLVGLGPLNLAVPRGYKRRHIYAAVVWQGFLDWVSEGSLEMVAGGSSLETFRQRWGTTVESAGGSSMPTWQSSDTGTGWRLGTPGWPAFFVSNYAPANYPNGVSMPAASDAITWSNQYAATGMYQVVMHPMTFVGNIDTVRFQFTRRNVIDVEAAPTVEVYLGCRTFN